MKFLFLFFLLPLHLFAQDITGVWVGALYNDTTKHFIKYEMAISENHGKLTGYSHTIFIIDSVQNIGVKTLKIKKSGDEYDVEDDKLIDDNYLEPPAKGVRTSSELKLTVNDTAMILEGAWSTNRTKIYQKLTGKIFLQKKKEIRKTQIIPKLESLGLVNTLSFMTSDVNGGSIAAVEKPAVSATKIKKEPADLAIKDVSKIPVPNKVNPETDLNERQNKSKNNITEAQKRNDLPLQKKDTFQIAMHEDVTKIPGKVTTEAPVNTKPDSVANSKKEKFTAKENNVVQKQDPIKTTTDIVSNKSESKQLADEQKVVKVTPSGNLRNDAALNTKASSKIVPRAAAGIATRQIETIRSVNIKSDSLLLTLYDNGEVDGDTVSVLLNGKVIMPLEGLSTKAINKTVYITPDMGDSLVLIMYAENLGSIPPNTGLLVVHDGEDVYYIRFSGDLKKNAAIILRRKKKI